MKKVLLALALVSTFSAHASKGCIVSTSSDVTSNEVVVSCPANTIIHEYADLSDCQKKAQVAYDIMFYRQYDKTFGDLITSVEPKYGELVSMAFEHHQVTGAFYRKQKSDDFANKAYKKCTRAY